eukprot:CAMPEP_0204899252 /NCGR_PEP_ID=MMETSP1397-20131031/1750_1 /ASSEMBLY_ACC=CAM_ASM_000891 /TAXON_ID=49980 /ORGANISM="Climacostomum Climacostomum virens, Strain Stock W-24" /LENGTH=274 /DNA_ID=CAMNT_0052067199 /DNA_START=108 /DNA_END=932 /DNA_ORIENTATION=+
MPPQQADPFDHGFFSPALRGFDQDPFASMNSMMQQMHSFTSNIFRQMDSHFGDIAGSFGSFPSDGRARSYVKTIHQSTKLDRNGNPITEKYENTAINVKDHDGTHVGERKQAYMNSGTGLQKYAVERKLGDRSRKVVQEKYKGDEVRSDLYRNMDEREADEFDRAWQNRGQQLGFSSINALPAPTGSQYGRHQAVARQHRDEDRRGEYVPDYLKRDYQPVRVNRDIQPAYPQARAITDGPRQPQAQPAARQANRPARPIQRARPASRHSAVSGG